MLYLVTGEFVDPGPLLPPDQVVVLLESLVLPSFEILARWEDEGKIKGGGIFVGERAGAWVLEADSADAAGELLASLPFWGVVRWHVRPLQSFRSSITRDGAVLARLKAMKG